MVRTIMLAAKVMEWQHTLRGCKHREPRTARLLGLPSVLQSASADFLTRPESRASGAVPLKGRIECAWMSPNKAVCHAEGEFWQFAAEEYDQQ